MNVKVAVRCRPFNKRETAMNARCIVEMSGQMTSMQNPMQPDKDPIRFTFDKSYFWDSA